MNLVKPVLFVGVGVLGVAAFVAAQNSAKPAGTPVPALKPNWGDLHLKTNIGSFKLIDGEGWVEVSFTGTTLVSQVKGTVIPSGNLRKEYDDKGRQVYHGTGKLTIEGQFRGIQWFGTNMNARWIGAGLARITGEFDKNLDTGSFWYGNDESKKRAWNSSGTTLLNPEARPGGTGVPTERPKTGKPGGG